MDIPIVGVGWVEMQPTPTMGMSIVGVGWVEMQRAVIRVLGIQVGNPRGNCCRFRD